MFFMCVCMFMCVYESLCVNLNMQIYKYILLTCNALVSAMPTFELKVKTTPTF